MGEFLLVWFALGFHYLACVFLSGTPFLLLLAPTDLIMMVPILCGVWCRSSSVRFCQCVFPGSTLRDDFTLGEEDESGRMDACISFICF